MSITDEARRESREKALPTTETRCQIIFDILSGGNMTANEIAQELYSRGIIPFYERNFAAPRLTELKKAGKVKTVGKRKCSLTGRNVAVWAKVGGENQAAQND